MIPDQVPSCWVPVGPRTPLSHAPSCAASCRGARRAVQISLAVTGISAQLSSAQLAGWRSVLTNEGRGNLGHRCCERTPLNSAPSIIPTEIIVLQVCTVLQNSTSRLCHQRGFLGLPASMWHHHPRNRRVCTGDALGPPRLKDIAGPGASSGRTTGQGAEMSSVLGYLPSYQSS